MKNYYVIVKRIIDSGIEYRSVICQEQFSYPTLEELKQYVRETLGEGFEICGITMIDPKEIGKIEIIPCDHCSKKRN